jgi:hypothetical protein
MTLNEARRSLDLPDLPYGDIPMNPTYLTAMQQAAEAEGAGAGPDGAGGEPGAGEEGGPTPAGGALPEGEPRYTEHFGLNPPLPGGGGVGR